MGLSNNDILKKLRVAHKFRDTDIIKICDLVNFKVSKSELGALFRNPDHDKYMECGDQILRNFLNGLVIHLRGPLPKKVKKDSSAPAKTGGAAETGIKTVIQELQSEPEPEPEAVTLPKRETPEEP